MSAPEPPDFRPGLPGSENPPELPLPTGQEEPVPDTQADDPQAREAAQHDAARRVQNEPRRP